MMSFEVLGMRLKDARETKGISQQALSEKLNTEGLAMSRETISKIENGSRMLNAVEMDIICKIISLDPKVLFHEEKEVDLVTMFRSYSRDGSNIDSVLDELQYVIKNIVAQKKVFEGKIVKKKRIPSWRSQ